MWQFVWQLAADLVHLNGQGLQDEHVDDGAEFI